jgi:hypothetical protein
MTRSLQDHPKAVAGRWLRNTAELSGELSVGDLVAVGDILLAVGRPAGWVPATGPLAEVRTREYGTRPLPMPAPDRSRPGPGGTHPEGDAS